MLSPSDCSSAPSCFLRCLPFDVSNALWRSTLKARCECHSPHPDAGVAPEGCLHLFTARASGASSGKRAHVSSLPRTYTDQLYYGSMFDNRLRAQGLVYFLFSFMKSNSCTLRMIVSPGLIGMVTISTLSPYFSRIILGTRYESEQLISRVNSNFNG